MIHLIGFTPDSPQRQVFESLYREGDICVFSDAGLLFASRLSLQGDGYLLQHPALALPDGPLPVIDHARLLELVAEHGPCTSWY